MQEVSQIMKLHTAPSSMIPFLLCGDSVQGQLVLSTFPQYCAGLDKQVGQLSKAVATNGNALCQATVVTGR